MSDPKSALVLHVPGTSQPLMFALSPEQAENVRGELDQFVAFGKTKTIHTADESSVVINFAHVVTAHIDQVPPLATVYGDP
ncbi:MAG: hypothetical protein GEU98_07785 [Pseudonocardiaceae bacterium]|nr:hypothetical protein [Pseudonocardiaceae bacterium]